MRLKVLFVLIASLAITHSQGQVGQVYFANRIPGALDAPVKLCTGTPLGPGWTAQLYLVNGIQIVPLTPSTTFMSAEAGTGEDRYWLPVTVDVPGFAPGQAATFVVRVYPTSAGSWDAALASGYNIGQSAPITASVGGGLMLPSNLLGLQAFTVGLLSCPDQSIITIGHSGTLVTLGFDTAGMTTNLVQVSTDLKNWRPYLNVFSKVSPVRVSDRATDDAPQPRMFYRARSRDAESISAQRVEWQKAGITNYTYKFKRTCFCPIYNLTGTVTVQNGKAISVEAYNDGGQPIQNPDLTQFKSIEDLFDLVESEQQKADVFTVGYDPVHRFPTVIDIDYVANAADDEIQYWATDVRPF